MLENYFPLKMSTNSPPPPPNTLTKSTQGYRCTGSREVTSLRCLMHERLTRHCFKMTMSFNYKRINVYSYKTSYQSVDANLFYSNFIRTFRCPLVRTRFVYSYWHILHVLFSKLSCRISPFQSCYRNEILMKSCKSSCDSSRLCRISCFSTSHLFPRHPLGRGIAGLLTFQILKPW